MLRSKAKFHNHKHNCPINCGADRHPYKVRMNQRKIVSKDEWIRERKILLAHEKEFTLLRDQLSKQKRSLPWVKIEKNYVFESAEGPVELSDLFENQRQLIVYHFMFGPHQSQGCKICAHWADQFDPAITHLRQRDTNFVCISRGNIKDLETFRQKMGWQFRWLSSKENSFNFDFQASALEGHEATYNFKKYVPVKDSELPGLSVFYKDDDGVVYHTYSCYARELETFNVTYRFLDIVPKGRNEVALPWPMAWVDLKTNYC